MDKPTMKRHVGITTQIESSRFIAFTANGTIAAKMADYGTLYKHGDLERDSYHLCVDPRYDFADVLAYLESMA